MAGKNTAVFGIYAKQPDFKKGLYQLKESGFRHEDISVLVPENMGTKELATEKATIVSALAGVGVGGAIGGFTGALIGMGLPEYEAKRYDGRIRGGGILLSVHCDDSEWTKRAKEILQLSGAEDISSSGEAAADFAKSDRPQPATGTYGE